MRTASWSAHGVRASAFRSGRRCGRAGRAEGPGRTTDRSGCAGCGREEGRWRRHGRRWRRRRARIAADARHTGGHGRDGGSACTEATSARRRGRRHAWRDDRPGGVSDLMGLAGLKEGGQQHVVRAGAHPIGAAGTCGRAAAPSQEQPDGAGNRGTRESPTIQGLHRIPGSGERRRSERPGTRSRRPSRPGSAAACGSW